MTHRLVPAALLAALIGLTGGPAHANLVANGGFESGGLTNWTLTGSGGGVAIDSTFPHSGTNDAAFALASGGTTSTLSQSIATTAGQSYSLSFWLLDEALASGNDTMTVTFGGFTDAVLWSNLGATSYTNVQLTIPGSAVTSISTTLGFQAIIDSNVNQTGFVGGPFNLDDILLTANIAAVPEPSADWLLLAGVLALGVVVGRRAAPSDTER